MQRQSVAPPPPWLRFVADPCPSPLWRSVVLALSCVTLHRPTLRYAVSPCIVLRCAVLGALLCAVLCGVTLYHPKSPCALRCVACGTLPPSIAMHSAVLHCLVTLCTVVRYEQLTCPLPRCHTLRRPALRCPLLGFRYPALLALCASDLRCAALSSAAGSGITLHCPVLYRPVSPYDTLRCTAPCCAAL